MLIYNYIFVKLQFRNRLDLMSNAVIPAKAGIQCMLVYQGTKAVWIPAFAGMTMVGSKRLHNFRTDFLSKFLACIW